MRHINFLLTPQEESPESSTDDDKHRGPLSHLCTSPKRQGVPRKAASISKHMSNLTTPSDGAKAVCISRKIIFGYVANDDDEERTALDEANDLKLIIAALSSGC